MLPLSQRGSRFSTPAACLPICSCQPAALINEQWHISLATTLIYAEVDIQMKIQALKMCEPHQKEQLRKPWKQQEDVMAFLKSL